MDNEITKGLKKKIEYKNVLKQLTEVLNMSELQSLLLDVFRRKAKQVRPDILLHNYKHNRFTQASSIDPMLFLKFDLLAFELLPSDYTRVELSPVSPIGTCSAIATVNQDKVISASRNVELIGDATNLLALEAAKRRKEILIKEQKSVGRIKLSASHRITRAQYFENKNYTPHFKVFNLCTAGRDQGSKRFEIETAIEHIEFYISLLYKVLDMNKTKKIKVRLLNFNKGNSHLKGGILKYFSDKEYKKLDFMVDQKDLSGFNYYKDLRFMINVTNNKDRSYDLIDGGYTNWTSMLLSDKKERLLTSCVGSELLLKTMNLNSYFT